MSVNKVLNLSTTPMASWDEWVVSQGVKVGFCQSSQWGIINAYINKKKPIQLILRNSEKPVVGSLFFLSQSSFLRNIALKIMGKKDGFLESHGGFLVDEIINISDIDNYFEMLNVFCIKNNLSLVRMHLSPLFKWQQKDQLESMLLKRGFSLNLWQTNMIDISCNPQDSLSGWPHALRKSIKKCQLEGVTIKRCENKDELLRKFIEPFFETRKALGYDIPKKLEDHIWWDLDPEFYYNFFYAESLNGEVLATLGTFRFNKVATEIMSERTLAGRSSKLPAQDFLHFHIFCYHHNLGDCFFDMAGFSPNPISKKEEGIKTYKIKWPGKILDCFIVEKKYC